MAGCGRPSVGLDARHLGAEFLSRQFRTVWKTCLEAGYDLSRQVVPVAPAAHYMIGGVESTSKVAPRCRACSPREKSPPLGFTGQTASPPTRFSRASSFPDGSFVLWMHGRPSPGRSGSSGLRPSRVEPGAPCGAREVQRLMSARVGVTRSDEALGEAYRGLARSSGRWRRPPRVPLRNSSSATSSPSRPWWSRRPLPHRESRHPLPERLPGARRRGLARARRLAPGQGPTVRAGERGRLRGQGTEGAGKGCGARTARRVVRKTKIIGAVRPWRPIGPRPSCRVSSGEAGPSAGARRRLPWTPGGGDCVPS